MISDEPSSFNNPPYESDLAKKMKDFERIADQLLESMSSALWDEQHNGLYYKEYDERKITKQYDNYNEDKEPKITTKDFQILHKEEFFKRLHNTEFFATNISRKNSQKINNNIVNNHDLIMQANQNIIPEILFAKNRNEAKHIKDNPKINQGYCGDDNMGY